MTAKGLQDVVNGYRQLGVCDNGDVRITAINANGSNIISTTYTETPKKGETQMEKPLDRLKVLDVDGYLVTLERNNIERIDTDTAVRDYFKVYCVSRHAAYFIKSIFFDDVVNFVLGRPLNSKIDNKQKSVEIINNDVRKISSSFIKNVEFNPPLTVVIWADGTKTFVKCDEPDKYDPEKGLAMAIAKKSLGNKFKTTQVISNWVDKKWFKEVK